MSRSWNRMETWLGLIVLLVGGVLAFVAGLHVYVTSTAETLHPDPQRVPSAIAAPPDPHWTQAVARGQQIMRAGIAARNIPGLSVAVGVGDALVWAEGFGWADLDDRTPVTAATRFRLGDTSIALTSAAAGLLIEDGRLGLDQPVQTYVPAYPVKAWPVTLGQVMGHVGGISGGGGDEEPLDESCDGPIDGLARFAGHPLRFEPGTQFRYSQYDWILVSAAIERAAGESFTSYMRTRVFEPTGMTATREDAPRGAVSQRATPYFPRYSADPRYGLHPMREGSYHCFAGAGAFISTPSDLVRFGLALGNGQLVRPQTVTRLQTPQTLRDGSSTGYGLGWSLETVTIAGVSSTVAGHDGRLLGGAAVSFLTVPDRRLVIAVMANISYADPRSLALDVARAFADQAPVSASAGASR